MWPDWRLDKEACEPTDFVRPALRDSQEGPYPEVDILEALICIASRAPPSLGFSHGLDGAGGKGVDNHWRSHGARMTDTTCACA